MNCYNIVIANKYTKEVIETINRMGNSEEDALQDMDIILGKNEMVLNITKIG